MNIPAARMREIESSSNLIAWMVPAGGPMAFRTPNKRNRGAASIGHSKDEIARSGHPPNDLYILAGRRWNRSKEERPKTALTRIEPRLRKARISAKPVKY